MCEVVINAHKCLNVERWAWEYKDAITLDQVCAQISVLSQTEIQPLEWVEPIDLNRQTWCRFRAKFPTQESATEFKLKWQ